MSEESDSLNAAVRLLVVDDDENNRDMLSRRLIRRGFTVDTAEDGPAAIRAIEAAHDENRDSPFDLVLLDIEMPGMSGFDVLRHVRQTHAATRLPIVIATARHDREDVVQALGLGANDYVTKPIDFPVVLARVQTQLDHKKAVDRIVGLEADVRRQNSELSRANARMRHSLELASQVQRSLLPTSSPMRVNGANFAWRFDPCDELGGDIFNAFELTDGRIALYLLDVSGHGVPAALLSVTLSRVLTPVNGPSLVECDDGQGNIVAREPAAVVAELNARFPLGERGGQYFTIFYAVFDCRERTLTYVSAGHPPALLIPSDGDARPLEGNGFAVGWVEGAEFEQHTLTLSPGDRIVTYSDGITETMDPADRHFGTAQLAAVLERFRTASMQDQVNGLMNAVTAFRADGEVSDDVTVLAFECACD
ncbi:MAG: SpoIIE family protein phosphatase [Tepidisphaeraceae bacterium]